MKLEAYGMTVPQMMTALGNANINVGGREIRIGQQSINIRGIGLIDDGGNDDLTKGYRVDDIENVVLSQSNGVPVRVKDVAQGLRGLRAEARHRRARPRRRHRRRHRGHAPDPAHRRDRPEVKAEIDKMNNDGSLPPGVKVVPYYDRTSLMQVTTHTVLHNLIFGCLLVFLIQWIFLGDLRSALIVAANIPFALLFASSCWCCSGENANLLSVGAVDFGIIVDSAVILVENIFRNFQCPKAERAQLLEHLAEGGFGADPTRERRTAVRAGPTACG